MKEFYAQDGGRYTYADDIVNLQELALAFSSIFDGCDSFIISGCNVEGSNISAGYVYLNGKIRRFNGANNCTWPQYIYEENNTEYTSYASGTPKAGRHIYGCTIGSSVPDRGMLVNGRPASIEIKQSGNMTIKDALFGKYAMIKESLVGCQTISDAITFNKTVRSNNSITATGQMVVVNGNTSCRIGASADKTEIVSVVGGRQYTLDFSGDNRGVLFYVGSTLAYQITDDGFVTNLIKATNLKAGNVSIAGNNIFNDVAQSHVACIDINMIGYGGAMNYCRDLRIGDGRGAAVIVVSGGTKAVSINGQLTVVSSQAAGMTLKALQNKDSNSLQKYIVWTDNSNSNIASLGYYGIANKTFQLSNSIGDVEIQGLKAVNIGPAIKENGKLLSEKYTLKTDFDAAAAAIKTGTLAQFINDKYTKQQACDDINAQTKLYDSGWRYAECYDCTSAIIAARQIGNVVYVTGYAEYAQQEIPYFTIDSSLIPPPSTFAMEPGGVLTFPTTIINNNVPSFAAYVPDEGVWRLWPYANMVITERSCYMNINFTYIIE